MSTTVNDPLARLRIALTNLTKTPPSKLKSPALQPRRASVAIIIRVRPRSVIPQTTTLYTKQAPLKNLDEFWSLPWVQGGDPEILYIKRALREGDRWSGQMAFPGGKQDPEDVDDLDTAEREAFEEVGLDLGNLEQFVCVGALDDREITTTFGKQLLMILCPFVFLQITPHPLPIEISGSEVASTHWIPISHFFQNTASSAVSVDISSRLAPKSRILQYMLQTLTGRMHFHCIKLPSFGNGEKMVNIDQEESVDINTSNHQGGYLQLWGLTLQMTSDLMDMMYEAGEEPPRRLDAICPKVDWPDVNFFIWWLLRKNRDSYRRENFELASRASWAGGLSDYYAALRKALLIAIFARTIFAFWLLRQGTRYLFGTG